MSAEPHTAFSGTTGSSTRAGELHWIPAEYDDSGLVDYLEPDQLADATALPVPPAQIGRRGQAGLWVLRVIALVVSAMVIYTFVYQTVHGHA